MNRVLLCALGALLLSACSEATEPKVPTTITLSATAITFDAIGALQIVTAVVKDQKGGVMNGTPITWTSSAPAVTVTSNGRDTATVSAAANGPATITATAGSATASITVQVTQVVVGLEKTGGDTQTGGAGTALAQQIRVKAVDRLGVAVAGQTITFAVAQGGGSVSPASVVTGADGIAATTWTIGTVAGAANELTATLASPAITVRFTATAVAGAAASIAIVSGNNQTASVGTAVPVRPSVRVADAFGNPVSGVTVVFTVTQGAGSLSGSSQVTNANGVATVDSWLLGQAGANQLTASIPGTTVPPVAFSATATGAGQGGTITLTSGDNQAAMGGTAVPIAPTITVRDPAGNALAGRTVIFAVGLGGGSVVGGTTTTNSAGVARVGSWILGSQAAMNTLTATVSGSDLANNPVTFTAAGCAGTGAGYRITLCVRTTLTSAQRTAFVNAANKWQAVITGDLADEVISESGLCGVGTPRIDFNVDDVLIFAAIQDIDGPGNVLGSAGPCAIRDGQGGLPIVGTMRFDGADLVSLEAGDILEAVILHEMGHVIGIGTMWTSFGLIQSPSSNSSVQDTHYTGVNGIAGFDMIGGATYTGGSKVPVENTGGSGTANAHWRESVLDNELMTGFVDDGSNPLSLLTVRSLQDLGYAVNTSAADPFFRPLSLRAQGPSESNDVRLSNDIYTGPVYKLNSRGGVDRIR